MLDGTTYVTTSAYDGLGRLTSVSYPTNPIKTVTYTYDGPQLKRVSEGATNYGDLCGVECVRPAGDATSGNGVITTYTYQPNTFRVASMDTVSNLTTPTAPGDNFNRANTLDLGASWDAGYTDQGGANTNLQIVGNRVRATTALRDATETYTGVTLANNQWVQLTLATANGTGAMAPAPASALQCAGCQVGV